MRDVLLEVGHEHEIPAAAEVALEALVEDVAEHRARLASLVAILVDAKRERRENVGELGSREGETGGVGNLGSLLSLGLIGVLVVEVLVALLLSLLRAPRVRLLLGSPGGGGFFLVYGEFVSLGELTRRKLAKSLVHRRGLVVEVLEESEGQLADHLGVVALDVVGDDLVGEDDKQRLVLHAKDVLLRVRVDRLHGLEVLVVETLGEGAQGAPQLNGRPRDDLVRGGPSLGLRRLGEGDLRVRREELPNAEQVVDAPLPDRDGHVRGHAAADVELRGDEHDEHLDLLRRALGNLGEVDERFDVFVPVRSLLTARRDDLLQLLIDHLVGDLLLGALHHVKHLGGLGAGAGLVLLGRGLAPLADSLEAVVVVIGGGLLLGALVVRVGVGVRHLLVGRFHLLPSRGDARGHDGIVPLVLAKPLPDRVERFRVGG